MDIHNWAVSKFIPYCRNPRKNDQAVERMIASIRECGFKIPILARSNGEVVDGHLRLKAAQQLGMTELPVILCGEWTPAQVKTFRLLVNRSASWAEWDSELVALELEELTAIDFDLSLTGFEPAEIDSSLMDESKEESADSAPAVFSRAAGGWNIAPHDRPHEFGASGPAGRFGGGHYNEIR